jgi:hypothetical protein
MPWPRFSILQLLLLAALCALVTGLATSSWRSRPWTLQSQPPGRNRPVEAAILTIGLVGWGIAWGVVARRRRPFSTEFAVPTELKLVWGLLFAGGLVAVTVPVALLVILGPQPWPGVYYALVIGLVLIVAGAGRRTRELGRVPILQMTNLVACDWVNFILGVICHGLLRKPHVQGYLHHVELSHQAKYTARAASPPTAKAPAR